MDVASDIVEKLTKQQTTQKAPPELIGEIENILNEARDDADDIIGALVTSCDGLPWAKSMSGAFEEKRFSAMSSALLALGTTMAKEASRGKTRNVMIECEDGNIYVISAGNALLLTVFTKSSNNLGMTLAHTRRAAERIAASHEQFMKTPSA